MAEEGGREGGGGGLDLSEKTKHNLKILENLQAEVVRQRALVRELEAHVANLVQERESQEHVLQNLTETDAQRSSTVSSLHEQLAAASAVRDDLEMQLESMSRDTAGMEKQLITRQHQLTAELEGVTKRCQQTEERLLQVSLSLPPSVPPSLTPSLPPTLSVSQKGAMRPRRGCCRSPSLPPPSHTLCFSTKNRAIVYLPSLDCSAVEQRSRICQPACERSAGVCV